MRLPIAVAIAVAALVLPAAASAATFQVTSELDTNGTCSTTCSLREAIKAANLNAGEDTITFSIVGTGVRTINLSSALPASTGGVSIRGRSQGGAGYTGTPLIELNGTSAGSGADGLVLQGGGTSAVSGLVINRFGGDGVEIAGTGDGEVMGSYVGTNATATSALPTAGFGGRVTGTSLNTIGGPSATAVNTISGNTAGGVKVAAPAAGATKLDGNFIGTNASLADVGNGGNGVEVTSGSAAIGSASTLNAIGGNAGHGVLVGSSAGTVTVMNNFVGTDSVAAAVPNDGTGVRVDDSSTTVGPGNTISANLGGGVELFGNSNVVKGNFIGTNAVGTAKIGAQPTGVRVNVGSGNVIGGTGASDGNVIGGNPTAGVRLDGPTNTRVEGNFIGTNASGSTSLENGNGVHATSAGAGNVIGGAAAGARNVISGNDSTGIVVQAASPAIVGNYIGTTPAGTAALANGNGGVSVSGTSTAVIGGTAAEPKNVISANGSSGIAIVTNGVTVRNNIVGSDKDGTADLGNDGYGVNVNGGDDNLLDGNQIAGNTLAGVNLVGANLTLPNKVWGNRIGTNAAGTAAIANAGGGVIAGPGKARIGNQVTGNLISGNTGDGVALTGGLGHVLEGNYIGTNAAGTAALPNSDDGVAASGGGPLSIGGTASSTSINVISGNGGDGVEDSTGATIGFNFIGVAGNNGQVDLGNTGDGLHLTSGAATVDRNVISGNSGGGIFTGGTAGPTIKRNHIGTDRDGIVDVGNDTNGIFAGGSGQHTIGDASGGRNTISGNAFDGVRLVTSHATVLGNRIGTGDDGVADLGNSANGVDVVTGGVQIGNGTDDGRNTIAHNARGIAVLSGTGTRISGNRIFANDALGIDLGFDNVTANDVGDSDTGPNGRQNFPLLGTAVQGGDGVGVSGSLATNAFGTYRIELFANDACDSSLLGEGQTLIDSFDVTTSGLGTASFSRLLADPPLAQGQFVTATATAPDGSTSEFSVCRTVTAAPAASVSDADATEGGTATFAVSLAAPSDAPAEVSFSTQSGTATQTDDYAGVGGTLTFAPGETSKQITVATVDDSADEPAETFELKLSGNRGARIGDGTGVATITDNDEPPAQQQEPQQQQGGGAALQPAPTPQGPAPAAASDADADGIPADGERKLRTSDTDRDSDDDGLADGAEDKNRNGAVDKKETSPAKADSDGDRLGDGLERGLKKGVPDPAGAVLGTDAKRFKPDKHPRSKTNPLKKDTDGDRKADGKEDRNRNGKVDRGETDPRKKGR
jgi:CSLREA domain-containing protein